MKAFVVAAETPKDESIFSEYRKAVPATLEALGGKFIVRGGDLKLLEGEWPHARLDSSSRRRSRCGSAGPILRSLRRNMNRRGVVGCASAASCFSVTAPAAILGGDEPKVLPLRRRTFEHVRPAAIPLVRARTNRPPGECEFGIVRR